jgi:type 1 fimbriae regulatory protein FimB/type 1 fimbriae regulatory protein FimE
MLRIICLCLDLLSQIKQLPVQITENVLTDRLVKRIGERAGFPFKVHVHMLRHACGYALANAGHDTRAIQDWLGHRAIQHTARYTELSQERFKDFWRT